MDSYDELANFISIVSSTGCSSFILHARIAILKGLSPKQNREVPPLNYPRIYEIKQNFPELEIIINGGIKNLSEAHEHLQHVDGVMLGREAYQHPYILSAVDQEFFNIKNEISERFKILELLLPYVARELKHGTALRHISRHILGLFQSQPGGKKFRRYLSENAYKPGADVSVIEHAMQLVQP
jgi:tRNA-dihydrouridine synthase A